MHPKLFYRDWDNGETIHEMHHEIGRIAAGLGVTSAFEFGCGNGKILELLRDKYGAKRLMGCDIAVRAVLAAQEKGLDVFVGDERVLYFLPRSFDLVFTCSVLDHMPEINDTVANLFRIGEAVLLAETQDMAGASHYYPHDYDALGFGRQAGEWLQPDGCRYHIWRSP